MALGRSVAGRPNVVEEPHPGAVGIVAIGRKVKQVVVLLLCLEVGQVGGRVNALGESDYRKYFLPLFFGGGLGWRVSFFKKKMLVVVAANGVAVDKKCARIFCIQIFVSRFPPVFFAFVFIFHYYLEK